MNRRLYFLFPDPEHAGRVIDELSREGVDRSHLHAMADPAVDLSALASRAPLSSAQAEDRAWRIEHRLWNANLGLFALALAGLLVALYLGLTGWAVAALAVMLATFVAGEQFAVKVPHAHLDEVRAALAHGEVLLMVDVPRQRVAEIEDLVHRRHPEAALGGVGWSTDALSV
jgi:hypothetical protein